MKFLNIFVLLVLLSVSIHCITQAGKGSDVDATLEPSKKITQSFSGVNYQMKMIYNSKGKFLTEEAAKLGVQTRDLAGVLKAESSGNGFASDGRMIIRFENHIFYNYYTNKGKDSNRVKIFNDHFKMDSSSRWKGHYFRASRTGAWESFHGNQSKEWQVLQFAQALDDTAGLYSASYGAAQIMGFNYKALGHSNVQNMFVAFSKSIKSQLQGLFSFIKNNSKCYNALKANPSQYVTFASCYNGSGQAQAYGDIINQAAKAFDTVVATIGGVDDSNITPPPVPSNGFKALNLVQFNTQINIRSGAGTGYSVAGTTSAGLQAGIISGPTSANGYNWYKIITSKGVVGFVADSNNWFSLVQDFQVGSNVRFNTTVKLRGSPSTTASQVGTAYSGNTGSIVSGPYAGNGYIWYQINVGGKNVYAATGTNWFSKI